MVCAGVAVVVGVLCGIAGWNAVLTLWGTLRLHALRRRLGRGNPNGPHAVALALREYGSMVRVALWGFLPRLHMPPAPVHVVCVHGAFANAGAMRGVQRRLLRAQHASTSVVLGRMFQHPAAFVAPLARALDEAIRACGTVDVVCHSMGGMVLRMALHEHAHLRAGVRRVVLLGSPQQGTLFSRGLPLPEARALCPESPLYRDLPSLLQLLQGVPLTCIVAGEDFIVTPREAACVPGAREVVLPGLGHAQLLTDRVALGAIVAALA